MYCKNGFPDEMLNKCFDINRFEDRIIIFLFDLINIHEKIGCN